MADLSKVSSRARLKARREPYWQKIRKGCFLGFRRGITTTEGQWHARYYDASKGGQKYQALGDFRELPESDRFDAASAAASKWFEHLGAGGASAAFTVKEVCIRYTQHVAESRGITAARDIQRRFSQYVYTFAPITEVEISKLTPAHIDKWKRWLRQLPTKSGPNRGGQRSEASLNRDLTCLRSALNYALLDGLASNDRAWKKHLLPARNADRRRSAFLDRQQALQLVDAVEPQFADFFHILTRLPLRPGAAAALKVEDFDGARRALRVSKDKSGAGRWIALPDATALLIAKFTEGKLPSAPLVGSPDGRHWNRHQWKKRFAEAAAKLHLPVGSVAYSLRHGCITSLLQAGVDPLTVAHLAGTSVRVIEAHYMHATSEHLRGALEQLAGG